MVTRKSGALFSFYSRDTQNDPRRRSRRVDVIFRVMLIFQKFCAISSSCFTRRRPKQGSVAIKIIQCIARCSRASDLSRRVAAGKRKSDFQSDQSVRAPTARLILLCTTTANFFSYRHAWPLTGMRTDVFRTTERNSAERCGAAVRGVTFCALLTNPQIENLRSDRADFQEAVGRAAPRLFFRSSPSTPQT